jgi:hypothetical protein
VIAKGVMAIAEMSPRPHHAVCAFFECPEYVCRADPAGTHYPDQPHVGGILHPPHSGSIRTRIRTPVAGENDDSRVKTICFLTHTYVSSSPILANSFFNSDVTRCFFVISLLTF